MLLRILLLRRGLFGWVGFGWWVSHAVRVHLGWELVWKLIYEKHSFIYQSQVWRGR